MRDRDIVKLILKLIALMGIIWGLGWLVYENTLIGNSFTTTNYQNILLVLMSATWLILLLGTFGKDQNFSQQSTPIPSVSNPSSTKSTRKHSSKNKIDIEALIKKALDKHLAQEDSS